MNSGSREKSNGAVFVKSSGYALDRSNHSYGSIVLDWYHNPHGEMVSWACCFQSAAQTLVRELSMRSDYADREACPIVFLYRHSLELYLKTLLLGQLTLRQAEGEEPIFPKQLLGQHNLKPLLGALEQTFTRFNRPWNFGDTGQYSPEDLDAVVAELEDLDPRSYSFRYPVTKSFELPSLPQHLRFDIFEFSARLEGILAGLQMLADSVAREIEKKLVFDEEEA